MSQGESHYPEGAESPLKALFLSSSKGAKEEFLIWLVDWYSDFLCMLLKRSPHAENVQCRGDKNG